MRIFSYRNKLRFRRLLTVLLALALLLLFFVVGYYFYLQRYVVYTAEGAYLDLPWRQEEQVESTLSAYVSGELVMDSQIARQTIEEEVEVVETVIEIEAPMQGYYVNPYTLSDVDAFLQTVDEALSELEGTEQEELTVMITVKSNTGYFYYNSSLGNVASCAETTQTLIDELSTRNVRLVAQMATFADSAYALENQSDGLPITGGALWMDENGCYWLDPTSQTAQDYVVAICRELRRLGFTEVMFTEFAFPESSNIIYDSSYSRSELTLQAAQSIAQSLSSSGLTLSFLATDTETLFAAAQVAGRIYLALDDGSQVASAVALYETVLEDPTLQLVFLTDSRDTRFSSYGILRPYT